MTPAEVAALLEQHGLAPHWRKPIRPAPILAVTDTLGASTEAKSWNRRHCTSLFGWEDHRLESHTWT